VGYNYRMTNLQAAVGCAQMEQLPTFIVAKRRISQRYNDAFRKNDSFGRFPEPEWAESAAWFSGFVFDTEDGDKRSLSIRTHLRERGIDARPFWKPMHLQAPYLDAPRTATPVSDRLWSRVVTLPCSTHLTEADQSKVIDAVQEWTRKN
jgi:dTDP-4-amino-4,6-dideoxygalactose transaminase